MSTVFNLISVLVIAAIHETSAAAKGQSINNDYPWGNLRTQKNSCDQEIMAVMCFELCGEKYICENNACQCADGDKPLKVSLRHSDNDWIYPYQDNQYLYSKEFDIPEVLRTAIEKDAALEDNDSDESKSKRIELEHSNPKYIEPEEYQPKYTKPNDNKDETIEHPTLRHHIAHFCPNLKKARTCIRTCMKKGKPAFCGKDHVCYCGHTYSSLDDKKKIDVIDVYSQYRDIYEKYFGPQIFEQALYDDDDDDRK